MDLKTAASLEGDASAPSENMTITSTWSGDENEEDDGSYYSDDESYYDSEASDDEDYQANKRLSYSKDLLKPTREGSLIQAGVFDPKQRTSKHNNPQHTPAYVHKQLKATSYGADVKKGADVPRDHVPQPVDPNAKLGDVYKRQSHKFKSTGYADQLKQGADVPRDHIVQPVDPNAKLGQVYASASTNLKKATGAAVANRILNSKKSDSHAKLLPAVSLQKTAPIEKPTIKSNALPKVALQKTAPISKPAIPHNALPKVALQKVDPPVEHNKPASSFELPPEFSIAQQNLKRRTERPWYSQGVEAGAPSKKWFFQRGEWSDETAAAANERSANTTSSSFANRQSMSSWWFGNEKTDHKTAKNNNKPSTTTFFRGSNSTVTTTKAKPANYHVANFYNKDGISTAPKTKSSKSPKASLKPFDKNYYENIQRRRKGLPPIQQQHQTSRIKIWLWRSFVGLLVAMTMTLLVVSQNDQALSLYQKHVQPMATVAYEQHVEPLYKAHVQPTVAMAAHRLQPMVAVAVERTCTLVEDLEWSTASQEELQYHQACLRWVQEHAMSACSAMREIAVGGTFSTPPEVPKQHREARTTPMKQNPDKTIPGERPVEKETHTYDEEKVCQCQQQEQQGPKLFRPVLGLLNKKKKQDDNCCL